MSGPAPAPQGLISVIVRGFGGLAFTRSCVAALARHTRRRWELIAIDNGSTDGTATYLAGVRDVAPFPVTIISNLEHRGFPAVFEQGLAVARGEVLVLLDNGVVVTDGWLDQLVALAEADPAIGIASPMSNGAEPPQSVPDVSYHDLDGMNRFAARWRTEHRGKWFKTARLSVPCLLVKRRVIEVIGVPAACDGWSSFEDEIAERARKARFDMAVARDLFIHHGRLQPCAATGPAEPPVGGSKRPDTKVRIFGVGLPRTGTTSVAMAMLELGLKTCHACFDDALFDRGDAFFDTPVYVDYQRLDRRYPGARFILTWREPHAWYASFVRSLGGYYQRLRTAVNLAPDNLVDRRCYLQAFGSGDLSESTLVARYHEHQRRIMAYFGDRPSDLLVLDLAAQCDPWEPLCRFLGLPRPSSLFPRLNTGAVDYWKQVIHEHKL